MAALYPWICSLSLGASHQLVTPSRVVDVRTANPVYNEALLHPCAPMMTRRAPERFAALFKTNYGLFEATCVRARAPVWVDRVFNLLSSGYYDHNYFYRVVHTSALKVVQFGTAANPQTSNIYNFESDALGECAVLHPQPPEMDCCSAWPRRSCANVDVLSNTFGTLSMSTGSTTTAEFPDGVTWNATAELFINTGDNAGRLDPLLFVPICTIDEVGMRTVLAFPSYGEVAELNGTGPSLRRLYAEGNAYVLADPRFDAMAITSAATLVADRDAVS
jgi:cyclophilin family peptidyl-prolyl cis-trans isomerase